MHRQFDNCTPVIAHPQIAHAVALALAPIRDQDEIAAMLVDVLQGRFGRGKAFNILRAAMEKAGKA